ncbi:MAG: DNA polymerase I, partial [Rhodobacteraceae bacterium]|nr:DNA polymerase I [Paracoccaceae bacterium]
MHSSVDSLPFDKIYAIDFEFFGQDGENPNVVCMVMQDLRSGRIERYWRDELIAMLVPPFDTGETTLLVSYFAPAELQCMITLDWCTEVSLVDLYAEFRCMTNGDANVTRRSLVSALAQFGLEDLIPNAKDETRDLILTGGPWTKVQQKSILDYCAQDVVALGPLFNEMLRAEAWDTLRLN